MCGLAGVFSTNNIGESDSSKVEKMISDLSHRGPDSKGFFKNNNVCLGFSRLSIIDIRNGNQPFTSANKRYVIIFNGEIYNYLEVKQKLEAKNITFRTNSDTELLIESFVYWGFDCLKYLNGMFAFAIYDKELNKLSLVRDRFGMKPIFFVEKKDQVFFASETQALIRSKIIDKNNLNLNSISTYLTFRQPIISDVFFNEIKTLEPGQIIEFDNNKNIKKSFYWKIPNMSEKIEGKTENYYTELIYEQLDRSIKEHLTSDVDVGVLLSGGLDSSIVTGLSSKYLKENFRTFSASYSHEGYDESKDAKVISDNFKTNHLNVEINYNNYLEENEKLIGKTLNPLMMPHEIPLNILFSEIKKKVKVVLSGEGADEFFGGYSRDQGLIFDYKKLKILQKNNLLKNKAVLSFLDLKKYISLNTLDFQSVLRKNYCWFSQEDKFNILSNDFSLQLNKDQETNVYFDKFFSDISVVNDDEKFIYFFQKLHLKALLRRLDYISMSNSVESRCPFLDHKLVETISRVPFEYKLRWKSKFNKFLGYFNSSARNSDNTIISKYILRNLSKKILTKKITNKKKIGFPTPLDLWFSNNLKLKAKEIILDKSFTSKNLFDEKKLISLIENKKNYPYDFWGKQIWLLINLSIWFNALEKN